MFHFTLSFLMGVFKPTATLPLNANPFLWNVYENVNELKLCGWVNPPSTVFPDILEEWHQHIHQVAHL